MADAEVKHDAAFLDRILDDRFIVIDFQGRTQDKAAFVATLLKSTMTSQTVSDETVRIFGDTAVILGTDTVQPSDGSTVFAAVHDHLREARGKMEGGSRGIQ